MNNRFSSYWHKGVLITFSLLLTTFLFGQQESTEPALQVQKADTSQQLNMDASYSRPFLQLGKLPVALGGYVEANTAYFSEDGVSEGLSFQIPRLTIFASSTITRGIRFLTEIEFEEGGREINIEFAALDIQFHPALNLRGGVVMNPIGAFNQNHDGPKWEFVNRPVAATQMLPATWSNVGFGLHGKFFRGPWTLGYEVYLTNGFDETIISNPDGRTSLPAAKANAERFEESFNGQSLFTSKIATRHRRLGEIGLSYMGGAYNKFEEDGLPIDEKRQIQAYAIDFNTKLPQLNTKITGEWAWVQLDMPENYAPQYGDKQQGGYLDIVQPVFTGQVLNWSAATVNIALRVEYVDWNAGSFEETGLNIGDDLFGLSGGLSFRPSVQTVLRLNYVYQWQHDLFDNPAARTAGWQFGVSSYF